MKQFIISAAVAAFLLLGGGGLTLSELMAQEVWEYPDEGASPVGITDDKFPDEIFRNYVKRFDTNDDGILDVDELEDVTKINVAEKGISSMDGIEYFYYLEELDCHSNNLTKLIFNNNPYLSKLKCSTNELTRLVVSGCPNLTYLKCGFNKLSSLNVSYNPELDTLYCHDNNLSSLNLENNPKLKCLDCSDNPITLLAFYNNKDLQSVDCYHCQINEASMEKLVQSLPAKGINSNGKLIVRRIDKGDERNVINTDQVNYAKQKGWDVKKVDWLNLGGGWAMSGGVFDYEGSTPTDTYIDMNTTTFPDANFRQALFYEDYGKDEVLGRKEIAKVKTMDVHGSGIADMTGVEYFTELTELNVSANRIHEIKYLSHLTKLKKLICYQNQIGEDEMGALIESLPTVTGGQLIAFEPNSSTEKNIVTTVQVAAAAQKGWTVKTSDGSNYAGCAPTGVAITAENFPDATLRQKLQTMYDVNQNGLLSAGEVSYITYLDMANKNATTLKGIEHLTSLTRIDCYQNRLGEDEMEELVQCLPTVSGGKLYAINTAYASEQNVITTEQVAKAREKGWTVYNQNNQQTYAGTTPTGYAINSTNFPDPVFREWVKSYDSNSNGKLSTAEVAAVTQMVLNNNAGISDLKGVELFTNLTKLKCSYNNLTRLDVSKLTKLTVLQCDNNSLTSLDVTKLTKLKTLGCSDCGLYSLNLSNNTLLEYLYCYGNKLSALDLTANTKLHDLYCYDNRLSEMAMQNIVDALPTITSGSATMRAVTLNYTGEQNVMSSEQVAVATGKNWQVYARSGGTSATFNTYAGASPTILVEINNTNFPEKPFRDYILENIDKNGDEKLSVGEAAVVTEFNFWGYNNLYYMHGLKYFTELKALYLNWNRIEELDLSKNTKLETLTFAGNRVTKMDLSKNTKLKRVDCYQNQIDESEMEALINSLPTTTGATISAINPNSEDEQNVVSTRQVAIAAQKGWTVTTGSSSGGSTAYAGTRPTTPEVNELNFPDRVFRQYVSDNCDTDHDGILSFTELKAVMSINVDAKGISTLDGIEFFSWLETLSCNVNNLSYLDVSKNTKLKYLYIYKNHINEEAMGRLVESMPSGVYEGVFFPLHSGWSDEENFINPEQVTQAKAKGWKVYDYSQFPTTEYEGGVHEGIKIDEEHFPDRNFRYVVGYRSIDQNEDGYLVDEELNGVTSIFASDDDIESLQGVGYFPNLRLLMCNDNLLTTLDLTGNTKLEELNCSNNQLTSIDISNNSQLEIVNCVGNQLSMAAMWTFIGNLPVRPDHDGKMYFRTDKVEDGNEMSTEQVAVLNEKGWSVYQYLNGLVVPYVGVKPTIYLTEEFFPDQALRDVLISVYSRLNLTEGCELTDEIIQNIMSLNLKNKGVTDITGYQYLTNLHDFNCYGLQLTTLDVSMLPELMSLDCTSNRYLRELDLSNNKNLRQLKCGGNSLESLDVSMLPDLEELYCDQNQLWTLKMGTHPNLYFMRCHDNHLDAIQMGKVVDALPQGPNDPGILMVNAKFPSANRFNTIYKSQVAEAVAKGWRVVNSSTEDYAGSDPVFGSGDADMSNTIDKWDIEIVVDYILGLVPDDYPGFDPIAADVNGDGRITIADVTLIIEKIESSTVED